MASTVTRWITADNKEIPKLYQIVASMPHAQTQQSIIVCPTKLSLTCSPETRLTRILEKVGCKQWLTENKLEEILGVKVMKVV